MKKKLTIKKIEDAIINLLEKEKRSMSIREITLELEKKYNIKYSQPIIRKILEHLKKEGKLEED